MAACPERAMSMGATPPGELQPSTKRARLGDGDGDGDGGQRGEDDPPESDSGRSASCDVEHCTICLQPFFDRTILPACAHEFCFACILRWAERSRTCPLCARPLDDARHPYLIHRVRSKYDYQKYHLPPRRSSPPPPPRRRVRARRWGARAASEADAEDELARRRWVYAHGLYAKHVASNRLTRYRPFPTPAQFAASPDLQGRMAAWLRRELWVWPNLDVEFLTAFTIALMKSLDIRSEPAVRLLAEFLDMDTPHVEGRRRCANAEHFAHEIYCYLRSPYRDLKVYDQTVQYDHDVPQSRSGSDRRSNSPLPLARADDAGATTRAPGMVAMPDHDQTLSLREAARRTEPILDAP